MSSLTLYLMCVVHRSRTVLSDSELTSPKKIRNIMSMDSSSPDDSDSSVIE